MTSQCFFDAILLICLLIQIMDPSLSPSIEDRNIELEAEDKGLTNDLKKMAAFIDTHTTNFDSFPYDTYLQEDDPVKARERIIQLIELNKEYQEILSVCVRHTEAAKQRNAELQKEIRTTSQSNKRRSTPKKPQGNFFSDGHNDIPFQNQDTLRKIDQEQKVPVHFKFKKWTKGERTNLAEGIVQQNKKILYNQIMTEHRQNPESKPSIAETAKWATERVNSLPKESFYQNTEGIDWENISKQFVPSRSAVDCQLQWLNNDLPSFISGQPANRGWTKAEDKRLLDLAKQYKNHEWEQIAKALGTNRTAFQCFSRYQRSLNTAIVKGKWTPQEDERLKDAIQQYGDKNWQQVAHYLNGRTGQQCLHRWQKNIETEY
uniref:Uncharacterized protein n=1 Tax=Vannella robusta TaxID=1487602 RepID=A0A7S4HSI4_9EUKA|mmetsp:Transcript_15154/g.19186  ORF Transcript_15154/g.19186 Transcript_15154/m.19186 type:complete len:375 (+) Transcript_15154:9-1133(+)